MGRTRKTFSLPWEVGMHRFSMSKSFLHVNVSVQPGVIKPSYCKITCHAKPTLSSSCLAELILALLPCDC